MRPSATATAALVLTALTAGAQPRRTAPQKPAARADAAVPFKPGETLTYDVSWSQFLTAATAVTKVVEKKPSFGSTAYSLVADGRPVPLVARFYALYYKMDSLLDSVTMQSQFSSLYVEEGARKRFTSMRFDRAKRRTYYEMSGQPPTKSDFAAPANVQDGLAMLYTLRTRTFRAGERFTVPVADDGTLYTANFETAAPQKVSVKLGTMDAWNLKVEILDAERQPIGKNIEVWISTDARRLPIKMQAELPVGSFTLALRQVD